MNQAILFDLNRNKQRLEYYTRLKSGNSSQKPPRALDKWIEIYSDRVKKLEKKLKSSTLN